MRKIASLLFLVILLLSLVSCGSKNEKNSTTETETHSTNTADTSTPIQSLKEVPAGFVKGFEEGVFSKYNSFASENGLGDTPIWIEGTYNDVSSLDSDDYIYYGAIVVDSEGNRWFVMLDVEGFGEKSTYTALYNHTLVIKGIYLGYTELYEMPAIEAVGFFDRETGNIITSKAGNLIYEDMLNSESTTDQSKENQPTQTGIRPEIKEAIDKYEEFINTYCDFMESFDKSNLSMLTKYAELVSQYSETQEQFEVLGNADLNDEELAYYTEVSLRCSSRLLEASSNLTSDVGNLVGSLPG